MKPEDRLSKNVTYVRLNEYIAAFMRSQHGGKILTFASTESYYTIMKDGLAKNEGFNRPLSKYSYCAAAVEYAKKHPGCSTGLFNDLYLPSEEELKNLVPVYMPNFIFRGGQLVEPSEHYQLNRESAKIFKRAAYEDFWTALILEIDKKSKAIRLRGETPNKKVILENFLTAHGINLDNLEGLYRNYTNHKHKLLFSTSQDYIPELDED